MVNYKEVMNVNSCNRHLIMRSYYTLVLTEHFSLADFLLICVILIHAKAEWLWGGGLAEVVGGGFVVDWGFSQNIFCQSRWINSRQVKFFLLIKKVVFKLF